MVVLARQKLEAESLERHVDLIVADGHDLPVRDGWFDACVVYGALHHMEKPAVAVANAARKLANKGWFYALDPHSSSVRWAFDWLMRVLPLYVEEASEDPLISEPMMREWLSSAGLDGETRLSTYLPPHLFVLTPEWFNVALLKVTDGLLNRIPGLRNMAGVIISEAQKCGCEPSAPGTS
jgi:SAM-dependent methyltransferase